jgi:hypothetical protein
VSLREQHCTIIPLELGGLAIHLSHATGAEPGGDVISGDFAYRPPQLVEEVHQGDHVVLRLLRFRCDSREIARRTGISPRRRASSPPAWSPTAPRHAQPSQYTVLYEKPKHGVGSRVSTSRAANSQQAWVQDRLQHPVHAAFPGRRLPPRPFHSQRTPCDFTPAVLDVRRVKQLGLAAHSKYPSFGLPS